MIWQWASECFYQFRLEGNVNRSQWLQTLKLIYIDLGWRARYSNFEKILSINILLIEKSICYWTECQQRAIALIIAVVAGWCICRRRISTDRVRCYAWIRRLLTINRGVGSVERRINDYWSWFIEMLFDPSIVDYLLRWDYIEIWEYSFPY